MITMKYTSTLLLLLLTVVTKAQQSYPVTFNHDGEIVHGTLTTPDGTGPIPTIIINPGSGANDRDGTIEMIGENIQCLYPDLLNNTLKPYKELSDALVDSGYAVLRYDKLEFTYHPTSLFPITFHKLWLPVESAIGYVKTRTDVDTNNIILIGHSEGSSLIPLIAKDRSDIKALISIAGARTPFDSILAYQLVNIAYTCNGDTTLARFQANQVLNYFNIIRTNNWNAGTPPIFGVAANVWYDYVLATDAVADHYNLVNLPTLFIGLGLDINVPPSELIRFQNEVSITEDFWSIADLNHYMTPNNDAHVSETLTDTMIYWLRQLELSSSTNDLANSATSMEIFPNPVSSNLSLAVQCDGSRNVTLMVYNMLGENVYMIQDNCDGGEYTKGIDLSFLPGGIYLLNVTIDDKRVVRKLIKQ